MYFSKLGYFSCLIWVCSFVCPLDSQATTKKNSTVKSARNSSSYALESKHTVVKKKKTNRALSRIKNKKITKKLARAIYSIDEGYAQVRDYGNFYCVDSDLGFDGQFHSTDCY